jgi:hypothetical protein
MSRESHLAKDHTDSHAVRFFDGNDRICDRARPDEDAGLHKHAVETYENRGIIVCICCGRTRAMRPDDYDQWYAVKDREEGARGTFARRRWTQGGRDGTTGADE